ncbi:putative gamma-glutamylcyclotransferase At3g02910 [Vigna radiata var. radiata]|uniref:Gamma-glutamylcyclotransferase family protein n=1 Tax=Vigna radiata var. radiata TaxID=3916 RepID=A0A1S3VMV3_VIGRR|nr:putative gamma-glutamylcyclotransferase At3g02910 [Vigna radiata var. radiata]
MERESEKAKLKTHLIFAYGTLKRGFPNHYLMEELMNQDDAVFVGVYLTEDHYPLVCGPHGIPYLINLPGLGHRVKGEIYAVSEGAVAKLDEFEGVSSGCYERLPLTVVAPVEEGGGRVEAEAYWGHRRFGEVLWKTKGEVGLKEYGEKEAKEYVRKENRLGGRNSILDLVP